MTSTPAGSMPSRSRTLKLDIKTYVETPRPCLQTYVFFPAQIRYWQESSQTRAADNLRHTHQMQYPAEPQRPPRSEDDSQIRRSKDRRRRYSGTDKTLRAASNNEFPECC